MLRDNAARMICVASLGFMGNPFQRGSQLLANKVQSDAFRFVKRNRSHRFLVEKRTKGQKPFVIDTHKVNA